MFEMNVFWIKNLIKKSPEGNILDEIKVGTDPIPD